jgi:hypothetical protein
MIDFANKTVTKGSLPDDVAHSFLSRVLMQFDPAQPPMLVRN